READRATVEVGRRERRRRPGAFLEVPHVGVARRAGQEDEDGVLGRLAEEDVRRDAGAAEKVRAQDVGEVRGDDAGAGNLEETAAGEARPEGEAARLAAGRALDGAFRKCRFA